jgi:hypothetical protein
MLYREMYNKLQNNEIRLNFSTFVIAGFNALTTSEQKIFEHLRNNYSADFYWDYDTYYTENEAQEAGAFMRDNIKNFPMPCWGNYDFNQIRTNKQRIQVISVEGETLQTACIADWINNLTIAYPQQLKQEDMVIIPCNETLLPFIVKALPDEFGGKPLKVNITMGYPFAQTELYTFVEQFLTSQIENQSPLAMLDNLSAAIWERYSKLQRNETNDSLIESAYQIDTKIKEFVEALKNVDDNGISSVFVEKTLLAELRSLALPFESDESEGLQIMGMLESRNLNFTHVLMLSTSDDYIPSISAYSTFIPHSIRKAYGLTSMEKRIAVFAYYFYRLFQYAKTLTFSYNTNSDSGKIKEISRFLQQIEVESEKKIEKITISPSKNEETTSENLQIIKTKEHIIQILQKNYLSATALNTFLDCEFRFVCKHILHIDAVSYEEDDVSALAFGNLFHHSTAMLNDLTDFEDKKCLYDIVNKALDELKEEYIKSKQKNTYDIITQIHKDIVINYLKILIVYNRKLKRKATMAEKMLTKDLNIEANDTNYTIKLGGVIDKIDIYDGFLVIADYKTGFSDEKMSDLESVFLNSDGKRPTYIFQVMFYCWLLWENNEVFAGQIPPYHYIVPQLLYISKLNQPNFKPEIQKKSDRETKRYDETLIYDLKMHEAFDNMLKTHIKRLLSINEDVFYHRNISEDNCKFCPFISLCQ